MSTDNDAPDEAQGHRVYERDLTEFVADPANPNKGNVRGRAVLADSVDRLGAGRSLVADKDGVIIAGNKTREALLRAGKTKAIVVEVDGDTPVIVQRTDMDMSDPTGTAREYAFMDNRAGELSLTWDDQVVVQAMNEGLDLSKLWDPTELLALNQGSGSSGGGASTGGGGKAKPDTTEGRRTLAEKFIVPPFSVLDAKQGYWQDRKRAWHALGINPVAGREHLRASVNQSAGKGYEYMDGRGADNGGSSFDPVLAELCVRWFCPPGGHVLDPFAGESTKGVVATYLGFQYTGVELRPEQVQTNRDQATFVGVTPDYVCGDSAKLEELLPVRDTYDLMFTSPPYYDLEIYSKSEKDGSAFATYDTFVAWYRGIIHAACARLKDNRFAVVKIGEVRDKKTGAYYNFVGDNIRIFTEAGLTYYNEAVLLTPIGSMPIRAGKQFVAGRKLSKGHQNVLVFYKGSPKTIKAEFGDVEFGDLPTPGDDTPDAADPAPADEAAS
jgi:DNA modification methylase